MWLSHPSFVQNVESWWNAFTPSGWPGFVFIEKLKELKKKLVVWNRETFGVVENSKREITAKIEAIDKEEERGMVSSESIAYRNTFKSKSSGRIS